MIPRRTLGRTGIEVPIVGYGSVPIGRPGARFEDAERLVNGVLEAGIDLLDTAAAYGTAEEFLGRILEGRRDEVTLVTKTGMDVGYGGSWSRAEMEALIERSLKRLRTDAVDVLLLHTCDLDALKQGDVVETIIAARDKGQARFIGYSGDNQALCYAAALGCFDVVETSLSLLDQANLPGIVQAHAAGLGVLLKRPIANAVIGRTEPPSDGYAAAYWSRWQAMGLRAEDVGEEPWLRAGIRFAAHAEGVTSALVGSGKLEHVLELAHAAAAGPLPPEQVVALERRFAACDQGWPGLT